MSIQNQCPAATQTAGQKLHGFTIERVVPIQELQATAYIARHDITGAQVIHLHCSDPENLFSITFKTPPPDSTGVAHILEHSVLAGSKKYPVKDAFNELSRGSLNTFINAFTAPDFTCYPVCSKVRADFFNLASVYTDLTLRPLLNESTFQREGHHLQLDDEGKLKLSGIVFNEMKGAFSTQERIAASTTQQALFPDSPYGVESGGLPECVPDLTYKDFCDFHHRFYSPTNARFFVYGDITTHDYLEFLGQQLADFEHVDVDSSVPDQKRWSEPRSIEADYPIAPDDPLENRSIVNLAWLTSPASDLEERLVLEVLETALVGNSAAPLRKTLIDSGLGQDLSPTTGLKNWYKEFPFVVGLRGTDPDKADEIESLIRNTLQDLAENGIASELLEAAIHQIEFSGLEISRRPMPFPITLLFSCLSTWLHGNDPLLPLTFPTLMKSVRSRWASDPDLFRKAISRWLVENPHRLRSVIKPSRTHAQEQVVTEKARLARLQDTMTQADLDRIRATVEALNAEQQKKDTAEELACLPRLEIKDIPTEVETIPCDEQQIKGVTAFEHDIFANNIVYLDVAFDISDIPEKLQPYLPLLGHASTGMGAGKLDYEAFATRKALVTGGVNAQLLATNRIADDQTLQLFVIRASALKRNISDMVGVVRDILTEGDLTNTTRLKDIFSQSRNQMRAAIAPSGHVFSMRSAAASLSLMGWRDEIWHGVSQLNFISGQVEAFSKNSTELTAKLSELRSLIFCRERMKINLTGESQSLIEMRTAVRGLIDAMPSGTSVGQQSLPEIKQLNPGVAIPGNSCYVARAIPVPGYTSPAAAGLWVLANHLRTGYMYKKIRIEGGAYGGFCLYTPLAGRISMGSYRDPNLEKTIEVYNSSIDNFLTEELTPDDYRKTIIGAMGRLEGVLDPAGKGFESMRRVLLGLSDEIRQNFHQNVLTTSVDEMRINAREIVKPALDSAVQAVYAPKERIESANKQLPAPFAITSIS